MPKSLNLVGESDFSNVGNEAHDEIVNSNGDVVATEVYNTVTKTVKYTFTDYVNDKKNVKGGFTKPVFADRERIPFSGVYDASVEIAGKQFNDKVDIEYSTPPIGISSSIIKVDNFSGENSYKQSIVVNPNRKGLIRPTVTIQGYHDIPSNSSTTIDKENTNLRIFKVNDISKVPESYYLNPDDSNLEEVTDEFYDSISYDSNSVSIDFADTNNPYVILVDGHYDESNNDIKTRVFLDSLLAGTGEENHEQFDNTFSFSSGSSMADGDEDVEDVKYSPNYGSEVTRPGQSVDLSQTGKVPENAKYEVIQNKLAEGWKAVVDESGKLTVTPSKEIAPGTSEDIPVKVTYSDGTSDEVSGKVTVVSNLADDNNPAYGEVTTKPGKPVDVEQTSDLPDNTKYEVNEDGVPEGWEATVGEDGKLTVIPSKDTPSGTSEDIPVKVTYSDGTSDDVTAKVNVVSDLADDNNPAYGEVTTKPGKPVDVEQTSDLPDKTKDEVIE